MFNKTKVVVTVALAVVLRFYANAEEIGPDWQTIMTDNGRPKPGKWIMLSHPNHKLMKTLNIPNNVKVIKKALLEYVIDTAPYDPKVKRHIKKSENETFKWANILIIINGAVIIDKPAGKYITKGLHQIEIPTNVLKEGSNTIEFAWKKLPDVPDAGRQYGYIYFATNIIKKPSESSFKSRNNGKSFTPLARKEENREAAIRLRLKLK